MSKRNDPVDLIAYIRSIEKRVDALDKRARRVLGGPLGTDEIGNASITEDKLDLTPQFTVGTTNLSVTATGTGTAQDTGLTLTAPADGDYMVWSHHNALPGSSATITVELRVDGAVVHSILLGGIIGSETLAGAINWLALGVTAGQIVKCTAFRASANGTYYGQDASLMMLRVGP